jgi:hypothetical protein
LDSSLRGIWALTQFLKTGRRWSRRGVDPLSRTSKSSALRQRMRVHDEAVSRRPRSFAWPLGEYCNTVAEHRAVAGVPER